MTVRGSIVLLAPILPHSEQLGAFAATAIRVQYFNVKVGNDCGLSNIYVGPQFCRVYNVVELT